MGLTMGELKQAGKYVFLIADGLFITNSLERLFPIEPPEIQLAIGIGLLFGFLYLTRGGLA